MINNNILKTENYERNIKQPPSPFGGYNLNKDMKTNLELTKQGYIGLNDAKEQVSKILRKMSHYTPVQFNLHQSDVEQVITLVGNGMITTIHTQPMMKGGAQ